MFIERTRFEYKKEYSIVKTTMRIWLMEKHFDYDFYCDV